MTGLCRLKCERAAPMDKIASCYIHPKSDCRFDSKISNCTLSEWSCGVCDTIEEPNCHASMKPTICDTYKEGSCNCGDIDLEKCESP